MAQKKYTDGSGVGEIWANIKNYIAAQLLGKSDVGHTHVKSEITDFPSLATVATSGSYNDLSNKPTIPTVNNATLTIQKNGTTVKTFTANASSNVTANITVPTKTSDLTNDNNFVNSLNNNTFFSWNTPVSGKLNIKVDQTWLGGILTTANTTIPTNTSDLTNDSGFITSEIDSSGSGWVRFKSGLQICYGSVSNISNVATGRTRFSFSAPFNEIPLIVTTPAIEYLYMITVVSESTTNGILSAFDGTNGSLMYTPNRIPVNYVAIGKWK